MKAATDGQAADEGSWRPQEDPRADPRKAAMLVNPDKDESLGDLGREQIMVILTVQQYVVTYADSLEDAWERMPNMMTFLDKANALSASLWGKGRSQVVEILKHEDPETPTAELAVPVESSGGEDGGGSRGI